ncbi:MAG: DUF947-domain-containing protein [Amphiamblys sp. WSBS2006]|nr:MAG: DUF947-domain-containing protein [Amphiamblys sp. WSBS2006]
MEGIKGPRVERSDKEVGVIRRTASRIPRSRDPRFGSLSTKLNQKMFEGAYGFLKERQEKEIKEIKKEVRNTRDKERTRKGEKVLRSIQSMQNISRRKEEERKVMNRHIKQDKRMQQKGKKAFYLKKSEKRRLFQENKKQLQGP